MAFPRPYGRYVLEDRLAMGGMAEIFRARTATAGFDKRVCIKRVLPHFLEDADFVTMFRDEARTAARLQHANVVQVFDFGEVVDDNDDHKTSLFLAMELVEGLDLRKLADASRKKRIPFTVGEITQIGIDICRGLHHAHTLRDESGELLGVVHRDISPHNVLVSKQGEVKITDFGIAKAAERSTHTSTGIVKGKVAYMSPEQAEGKPFDHRLDQWATGVVLWELLCGERLFRGDNDITILRKVLNVEVPAPTTLRDDVPAELEAIIMQALSGEPDDRFADMRQMELALSRFLFSGAIDPATAEVRTAYARITEGGAADQPRRTNVLAIAAVLPTVPPTAIRRDEQRGSTTDDEKQMPGPAISGPPSILLSASTAFAVAPSSLSSDEESKVFGSSAKLPIAPRGAPLSEPATLIVDDAVSLDAAAAAFDLQAARRPGVMPSPSASLSPSSLLASDTLELQPVKLPVSVSPERSRSQRQAPGPVTELGDGDLVAAARSAAEAVLAADTTVAEDDGTPATRTLVPASELSSMSAPKPVAPGALVVVDDDDDLKIPGQRRPLYAALAILGVGAAIGLVVAVGGGSSEAAITPAVAAIAAPATAPLPPVELVVSAPPLVEPAAIEPPAPAAIEPAPVVVEAVVQAPTPQPAEVAARPTAKPTVAASKATKASKPVSAAEEANGPPGSVYVDVPGGWATVTIGKKSYGETPVTLQLPSGRQQITLTSGDGSKKKTVGVTVIAGKKVQVTETF